MKQRFILKPLLWAGLSLLLSIAVACSDTIRVPGPTPRPAAALPLAQSQGDNASATPTPDRIPRIGRLVLATSVVPGTEAPQGEATSIPANTAVIYLVVEVVALPGNSTLSAVWDFGDTEVGRTDRVVSQSVTSPRWVSLAWKPQQPLKPGDYTVHFLVNDQEIDSLLFTVSGRLAGPATAVTERQLLFTTALSPDMQRIQPTTIFPAGVTTVVALVPDAGTLAGGNVQTRWYYHDQLIAEVGPDPVNTPNLLTFTLTAQQPLPSGSYRVELLLNGALALSGQFQVLAPTPTATIAVVEQVLVVTAVDPVTHAPASLVSLTAVQAPVSVYVAILVRDVTPSDLIEVIWYRNDVEVLRVPVSGLHIQHQWLNVPYQIPGQSPGAVVNYRVDILLNGHAVGQRTLQVRS